MGGDGYSQEVEERWGDTDAYRESSRRTARYATADWQRIKVEQDAVGARIAAALRAGHPADSEEAMDAVEAHRRLISRYFYDLPREMHVHLGDRYVSDPRFTRHYEQQAPGLAQYVRAAIAANAQR
jgi:hypothetical protein